jgi:hypothetical protein
LAAPKEIIDLVERFESNLESYKSGHYNETQVRREFVDPFFKALGWDIDNEQGFAEAYKDVIHEDAIKIGATTKAPDYSFRIGGQRKFFLETKKPSVDIKDDIHPAFQLRRYAWTAKLPLSVITDFEEFAVYDCHVKPDKMDKASNARIFYLNYKDYLTRWDEIAGILSKNAVLKGSFDKYAADKKNKRGTSEVDAAFLEEIAGWREILARNIALRNPDLSTKDLNYAVQAIVNRIVFLRICEDRGIERLMKLQDLLNGERVYPRLCEIFRRADERYNSGIFHFEKEPGRESPDTLTLNLNIDDKPLKEIIKRLYYPDSPYEFSVLPAEILGQVYEQFLGKVIRLTEGHRAVVEDKPEVKKAGGVKYTPVYIVEAIVKKTLGPMLEGKTPLAVVLISVLDPACGSGSFLIVAYQYLLDWHRDWYVQNLVPLLQSGLKPSSPEIRRLLPGVEAGKKGRKKEPELPIYQGRGGEWRLTTAERKRILLNNIYGVDIDRQAVEVTKLSLLLKVLEGENDETISKQLKLFQERALPDLSNNIKCGNSLIGWDILKDNPGLTQEDIERINPFDWEKEFPEIFLRGGFSVVIGNPPYGASFGDAEAAYFRKMYRVFRGVKDVYTCFMEAGLTLLKKDGKFSFIVPSAWLGGPDYECVRRYLLSYSIDTIVLLPFDVFADVYIDTAIFVVSKSDTLKDHQVLTYIYGKKEKLTSITLAEQDYKSVSQDIWRRTESKKFVLEPETIKLLEQIRQRCSSIFGDMVNIKRGVLFDKGLLTKTCISSNSHRYFEGDVFRYQLNLIANNWIEFGDQMKERPKEFVWFNEPRILLRRLVNRRQRLMATFTSDTFITNKNLYSVLPKDKDLPVMVIMGVLNSRLISYLYVNQVTQATKDDFPQVTIKDLKALPFPEMIDITYQTRMVSLVDQMLSLHKQLKEARTPHEQTGLQRQIEATDEQIDALVYELYGLTEEEIRIVEGI